MGRGKKGSVRNKSGGRGYASAMQDHEDRLDYNGPKRQINDTAPLIWSPYRYDPLFDWRKMPATNTATKESLKLYGEMIREKPRGKSNFTIWDALEAHRAGAKRSKASRKDFVHSFVQFPTDIPLKSEDDEKRLLAVAVEFMNDMHGGNAVFHARLDRDEKGRHGVDVFYAPRYQKRTARGTEDWISLTKFLKERARAEFGDRPKTKKNQITGEREEVMDKDGYPIMEKCDSPYYQGRAIQELFFEHLRDEMKLDFDVVRGEPKKTRDPDWKTPEQIAAEREAEKKLGAIRAETEKAAQERAEAEKALTDAKHALEASRALLEPLRAAYEAVRGWRARVNKTPDERFTEAWAELKNARWLHEQGEVDDRTLERATKEYMQCRAENGLIVQFKRHEHHWLIINFLGGDREIRLDIPDCVSMAPRATKAAAERIQAGMWSMLKNIKNGEFLEIYEPRCAETGYLRNVATATRLMCKGIFQCDAPRDFSNIAPPPEAKPFLDLPATAQVAVKEAFEAEAEIVPPAPSASPSP